MVNFQTPSCQCAYWRSRRWPCRHMFALMNELEECSWDSLPDEYRSSVFITLDDRHYDYQSNHRTPVEQKHMTTHFVPSNEPYPTHPLTHASSDTHAHREVNSVASSVRTKCKSIESLSYECQNIEILHSVQNSLTQLTTSLHQHIPNRGNGLNADTERSLTWWSNGLYYQGCSG